MMLIVTQARHSTVHSRGPDEIKKKISWEPLVPVTGTTLWTNEMGEGQKHVM